MASNNNQQRMEVVPPKNPGPTVGTMLRGALFLAGIPVPKSR